MDAVQGAIQIRPFPWSKVVPILLTLLLTGGAVIWRLARYPERDEFEAQGDRLGQQIESMRTQVHALEKELLRTRGAVDELTAEQRGLSDKFGIVLRERRKTK